MHQRPGIRLIVATILIAALSKSEAYQFVPTDAEWHSWPAYCKAKYVWTNIGKGSKFVNGVSQLHRLELEKWENDGIRGLHHYCAGAIYLKRAMLENDDRQRRHLLEEALGETQFSFSRSNENSPYYAYLATQVATILYEQEKFEDALQILSTVVRAQPKNEVLYSAIAVMQRRLGNLQEAKHTLLRGNEAVEGRSAEINYNLGLICIELGEVDEAVKYAEAAYALGFPLPGLRTKLERLGRM